MKVPLKEKLYYKFERFMARGGSAIFLSLLLVFIASFVLIIGVRYLFLIFVPEYDHLKDFWDHIWAIFLQLTDPGNMNQDNDSSTITKISTVLAGFAGVIILSMLIAFITSALESMLFEFRKGRGKILESEHTIILGWNERVVDILRELILANESEAQATVVILSEHEKEEMDDKIIKRLPDTKTTSIITTSGDPSNINELHRVGADRARSVIVLARSADSADVMEKNISDNAGIKTVMALIACQGGVNKIPIIAEIFNEERRDIIRNLGDDNVISLDSWDIMGKLIVQTSLTSGLGTVYNEILSFDGAEIYFYEADWNGIAFQDLPFHFEDGIPLGIHGADGSLLLRPPEGTILKDDDEILILGDDDSTIQFKDKQLYQPEDIAFADRKSETKSKRILILGWHDIGNIFVRESDDYLLEGSTFDVMHSDPTDEIKSEIQKLHGEFKNHSIRLIVSNTMSLAKLKKIEPFSYDNILILSQHAGDLPPDQIDADTLMILLQLKRLGKEFPDNKTQIITQVLNSDNQELIVQTNVDNFIISNKLITMILAQLSEEPNIKKLYDDIFTQDGSEIYVKPVSLYFQSLPAKVKFADLIALAFKREEICLGVRIGDKAMLAAENFGVRLNMDKDELLEITERDFLVVLAEDEL